MSRSHDYIECPICRSGMAIPRGADRTFYTCRNGHRFVGGRPSGRWARWPTPGPVLALVISVLLIALFLASQLSAMARFIHVG